MIFRNMSQELGRQLRAGDKDLALIFTSLPSGNWEATEQQGYLILEKQNRGESAKAWPGLMGLKTF